MPNEKRKAYLINFIGVLAVFLLLMALFESGFWEAVQIISGELPPPPAIPSLW